MAQDVKMKGLGLWGPSDLEEVKEEEAGAHFQPRQSCHTSPWWGLVSRAPRLKGLMQLLGRRRAVGSTYETSEAREIDDNCVIDVGSESDESLLRELES